MPKAVVASLPEGNEGEGAKVFIVVFFDPGHLAQFLSLTQVDAQQLQ
jgi:hypothetical protein